MVIDFSNLGGGGGGSYTLPIASNSTLGGVKIGSGVNIDSAGTITVDAQGGGIEVVSQLPASGTDGQMVMLVETANGEERQTLFVYGTSPKPAIEYHLSTDGRILSVNWLDIQRVMADGDTMFEVRYFGDISYSAGTIYSKASSGFGTKTPSSAVQSQNFINFQLDGDMLNFWMKYNRYISASTFSNKAQISGWTREGITQEKYTEGYANDQRCGMVMVNNRSDGLYMEDGFLKCSVSATTQTATTTTAGVVKPSSGLNIDNQGTLTTQVQTENVGNHVVKIWLGTQAEFDQIATPDQYTVYIIKQTATQSN